METRCGPLKLKIKRSTKPEDSLQIFEELNLIPPTKDQQKNGICDGAQGCGHLGYYSTIVECILQ